MLLEELDFHIPEGLIAQEPLAQRDSCRLLHIAADGRRAHRVFSDLPGILRRGDTLVFNDSRVLPARVQTHRATGGKVELLFLRPMGGGKGPAERWEALARPSHRLKPGEEVELGEGDSVALCERLSEGSWLVEARGGRSLLAIMERHGLLPLPPYIKTYPADPSSYQTVYAAAPGSAAAPTAGLHFTPTLQERLRAGGVEAAYVTLHVGLDTFQPIREATVEAHKIHQEAFSVSAEALATIRSARAEGRRIVAVGTTATRVIETLAGLGALDDQAGQPVGADGSLAPTGGGGGLSASTEIYMTPGYRFRAVDALITNFHLPRSTVLALTMAFVGVERVREAYAEAIAMKYRFFSFGDAMLAEGRDAHV